LDGTRPTKDPFDFRLRLVAHARHHVVRAAAGPPHYSSLVAQPGRTLWEEMVADYNGGAEEARGFEALWKMPQGRVDEERYQAVLSNLH